MLEEAGADTVEAVFVTVKPSSDAEFAKNIDGLVSLGLVRKEKREWVGRTWTDLVLTERGFKAFRE